MRYELYLCLKNSNFNLYAKQIQSDNIKELFDYVFDFNMPKYLENENSNIQWIYLDNEPDEYNILNLGFTTVPTHEECRKRIFDCKFEKYFDSIKIEEPEEHTYENYCKKYDEILEIASNETENICSKLFSYEPIIRLQFSNKILKPNNTNKLI